jgi:hypothetical protein
MALINFKDWLSYGESSAMTRQRDAWMRYGSYPLRADFMSRSTPHPAAFEKLEKLLGKNSDSDDSNLNKIFKDGDDIKPFKKKKKRKKKSN